MTRMSSTSTRTRGAKVRDVGTNEQAKDLRALKKLGQGKRTVSKEVVSKDELVIKQEVVVKQEVVIKQEVIVKEEEIEFENASVSYGLDDYEHLVAQDEARRNNLKFKGEDEFSDVDNPDEVENDYKEGDDDVDANTDDANDADYIYDGGDDVYNDSEQKKYKCAQCAYTTPRKDNLVRHLKRHVRKVEETHVCHICSKKFPKRSVLKEHMKRHDGRRPYSCKKCQSSFYNSTNLRDHMKRHLGVRDHECDLCGKGFCRRDALRNHVTHFHNDQPAFRCSICNKSFKGHILAHLRMHMKEKPFKCEYCDMRFGQSSQLVVHKRTHTGVKPYQCQVCNAAFSHSTTLRLHVLTHSGEKPNKCLLCPAAFVQLPHLKKHMRCIHKTEKPYVCVPCYVFFKTKVELEEHVATNNCKPSLPPAATPSGAKSPVQGETPEDAYDPRVEPAESREVCSTPTGPPPNSLSKSSKRKIGVVMKEENSLPQRTKRSNQKSSSCNEEVDSSDEDTPLATYITSREIKEEPEDSLDDDAPLAHYITAVAN